MIAVLVIFLPWQFVPDDSGENSIYRILLHSIWVSALVYGFFRVKGFDRKLKWTIRSIALVWFIIGMAAIGGHMMFFGLPYEMNKYIWYEKEDNPQEKVIYVYYKGFLPTQGQWEFKRIVTFPKWKFRLEKDFSESELNGVWHVYDLYDDFKYDRTVRFKDGEIQEILRTAANSSYTPAGAQISYRMEIVKLESRCSEGWSRNTCRRLAAARWASCENEQTINHIDHFLNLHSL